MNNINNLSILEADSNEFQSFLAKVKSQDLIKLINQIALLPSTDELIILMLTRLVELEPSSLESKFALAARINMKDTHQAKAQSRDIVLEMIEKNPHLLTINSDFNQSVLRFTAIQCFAVGPKNKALELFETLTKMSGAASDYQWLSECLVEENMLEESVIALEKSMQLDPVNFNTQANIDTIELAKTNFPKTNESIKKPTITKKRVARYPETNDFLGDTFKLMNDHIANNFNSASKFINKKTQFFTLGSCFAKNMAKALITNGYKCQFLELSEVINTSYANRAFIDWLKNPSIKSALNERITELLPVGKSYEDILKIFSNADVFILTMGVSPAFFDRISNEFVLPRNSALNVRALAEKYNYRTTSVAENVDNLNYTIQFIREINPKIKIFLTVSPVPMLASFEFESCVQADCLSKSILRVAAHELVNNCGHKEIFYWPSFELFRWGGSNASNYFGADDGAAWHVSESKVNDAVKSFISFFS